jgi:hypothetical protein
VAKNMNSHKEISYKKYAPKSMRSDKEKKNEQHKASSRRRTRQEKDADFTHRQRAGKEGGITLINLISKSHQNIMQQRA